MATPAASVIIQLHYIKTETLYRLVTSVSQVKWTGAGYDVSAITLTVSHVSGASSESLAYADWSKHGLTVAMVSKRPAMAAVSGTMNSGSFPLGTTRYEYVTFQLKKDGVVIDTVTVGVYADGDTGDPAVSYELQLSPDNLHFDADGTGDYDVQVTAYRITGDKREIAKLGDEIALLCLYGTKPDGTAAFPVPINSLASGSAINGHSIRKELFTMYVSGAREIELRAQEKNGTANLAVKSIPILRDGGRGMTGATVPPPMLWSAYPDDYEFQDGVTARDGTPATRQDCVMLLNTNGTANLYLCITSHLKSEGVDDNGNPLAPNVDSNRWKAADIQNVQLVATNVLLADNAFIGLLSSNGIQLWETLADGTRQIVGEIIGGSARESAYTIWVGGYKDADGIVYPQWAVDGNGNHFIGSKTGQRIELRPDDKSIEVFEEGREDPCLTIDGKRISNPLGYLGGDTGSVDIRATSGTSATASQVVADVTAVADKTISVVMGEVTLNATSYYPLLSSDSSAALNVMNNATITLRLVAVKSGGTTVEREVSAVFASDTMPPVGAVRGMSYSQSKTTKNLRLSLAGLVGKYQVKAMWTVTAQSGASASGKWSGLSGIVPAAVTDYKALFGANFMLLSKSVENYMAVYEDASRGIVTEMRNGLYGLRLNDRGVQMCCGSDNYEPVPVTLFRGALYFFSGTGVQPIFGNAKYAHTFDGAYDGLSAADCTTGGCFKRLSASQIEIDLTLWKTKLGAELNWGNLFVHTSCTGNLMVSAGFDSDYTKLTLTVRNPTTGAAYTAGTIVQCEMVYYPAK